MTITIMVVEDEKIIANDISYSLETLGYHVVATVAYGEDAVPRALELRPDLILMDIRLKGKMDGISAARQIQAQLDIPVVYLTAMADEQTLQRAKVTEPFGYLLKPFDEQELRITIEIALYRHKLEQKLKTNERWLATTLQSIGEGVITTDPEGRINFMNPRAEALTGWPQTTALGQQARAVFRIVDEMDQTPLECPVSKLLNGAAGPLEAAHTLLLAQDGTITSIDYNVAPISSAGEPLAGTVLAFRNITERRQLEERLAAIYQLGQELTLLHSEDVILRRVVETTAHVLHLNIAGLGLVDTAANELVYRYYLGANSQADFTRFSLSGDTPYGIGVAVVRSGQAINVPDTTQEARYVAISHLPASCSELCVPMRVAEQVIGVLNVESDEPNHFTPADQQLLQLLADQAAAALENARLYRNLQYQMQMLRGTQAQLVQSERMAALGRLVASIAHEINNPLQAIQGVLSLLEIELAGQHRQEKIERYLGVAGTEIERIASIVHRMRDFYRPTSREQSGQAGTINGFYRLDQAEALQADFRAIMESIFQLVNKKLQYHKIKVQQILADDLPLLPISPDHLKQVMLNLTLNAIDALEETGGTIQVSGGLDQATFPEGQTQAVARIEFSDSGAGMSPEILSRLFEPLFSTKDHGSGLGLFTSYQIIQANRGQIKATSQVGKGTTFTILLPLATTLVTG
ncbi:MAG: response regulator [Anaerolineae bacterium]|nr:response regulator [Anaerolineae bacterium]